MTLSKVLFTVILACSLTLGACTASQQKYAIDAALTASELSNLKKQYVYVEQIVKSKQDQFTPEEWKELLTVSATINILITKIDDIITLKASNLSPEELSYTWRLAIDSYERSRQVLMNHWEDFTPSEQVLLYTFDDHAKVTNDRIDELLNDPTNAGINQSLILISGLGALALKLLLVF